MSPRSFVIGWAAALLGLAPSPASADEWKAAAPGYEWSFPADHGAHPDYQTEWWYLTGHLFDVNDPSRRFGYQFTIFRVGLVPPLEEALDSDWATSGLIMGHASLTDVANEDHRFSQVIRRAGSLLGDFTTKAEAAAPDSAARQAIAWCAGPTGTPERWTIDWNGSAFDFRARDDAEGFALELETTPAKPLVLQGPGGYSRKGDSPTAASLYYSFTRLTTAGTIEVDGEAIEVRGESWMDKEFGSNQLADGQEGWDWFSFHLADGRELMLYQLRDESGAPDFRWGTLVGTDGAPTYLQTGDWTLQELDTWRSPDTDAEYPVRWRIEAPRIGVALEVVPVMQAQENVATGTAGLNYWEGAVDLFDFDGTPKGRGYVELTGYGDGAPPGI